MGLIDCPGASYSLPWKLAIMSSDSFSPSVGSRQRLKAMSGNRLVDCYKASLDIQKWDVYTLWRKGKGRRRQVFGEAGRDRESEIQDATLRWKNCRSLGVGPLSGGEESGPHRRAILRWSEFLGHSLWCCCEHDNILNSRRLWVSWLCVCAKVNKVSHYAACQPRNNFFRQLKNVLSL